jgi:hypothetical protein
MSSKTLSNHNRLFKRRSFMVIPLIFSVFLFAGSMATTSGNADSPAPSPTPTFFPSGETDPESQLLQSDMLSPSYNLQSEALNQFNPIAVQSLYVLANGNNSQTNFSLKQNTLYTIRVSGLWVWGGCDSYYCPGAGPTYIRYGDGAFLTDDHFYHFSDPSWSSFIYLEMNGGRIFPNNSNLYNSDHVYFYYTIGNGQKLTFKIRDCASCYGDNAGSLRVEIFEGYMSGGEKDHGVKIFTQMSHPNGVWSWGEDYMQSAPPDQQDTKCGQPAQSGETKFCTYGCLATSWAMLIDQWGLKYNFHTSPHELNKWLCENDGYYYGSNLRPHKTGEYVLKMAGKAFATPTNRPRDDNLLRSLLYNQGPVILRRPTGGGYHFFLSTGYHFYLDAGSETTFHVNDPGGCNLNVYTTPLTTLQKRYGYFDKMTWGFEVSGGGGIASLTFSLASPAELVVTNPLGQRTGFDPRGEVTFDEIPDAVYYEEQIAPDEEGVSPPPPIKIFDTTSPTSGSYTIQVIGTGIGTYHLDLQRYDESGEPSYLLVEDQTNAGKVDEYRVDFSPVPGEPFQITRIVSTDIKPGSDPNAVNCQNKEQIISVAILTTENFDAADVDYTSVPFENAIEIHRNKKTGMPIKHLMDVDDDGDLDLVFHFKLEETDLTCSSSRGVISGYLANGLAFEGADDLFMINP